MQIVLHFYELLCLNSMFKSAFIMKCITAGKRNNSKVKLSLLQAEKVGIATGIRARFCLRKSWRHPAHEVLTTPEWHLWMLKGGLMNDYLIHRMVRNKRKALCSSRYLMTKGGDQPVLLLPPLPSVKTLQLFRYNPLKKLLFGKWCFPTFLSHALCPDTGCKCKGGCLTLFSERVR